MRDNKQVIIKKLLTIFKDRFDMDLEKEIEGFEDQHFFGDKIGMMPNDLLYLFFDVENEFNITISQEYILSGKFSSIKEVAEIISNELQSVLNGITN